MMPAARENAAGRPAAREVVFANLANQDVDFMASSTGVRYEVPRNTVLNSVG
jgi:hypothetical protein